MASRIAVALIVLVGVSGVAQAQSGPPLDPNGRPYITSGPQPSPGDYTRERPGMQPADPQSTAAVPRPRGGQHDTAFKDEYGFRYDAQGDRIDAAGRKISPHSTQP
jgi:hypothetical protein